MRTPFSLKRQSLFYIKYIESRNPPQLKSIYRKYLKSGMSLYKHCNISLGTYLFKLLQYKKTHLLSQYGKLNQLAQLLKHFQEKQKSQNKIIDETISKISIQSSSQQINLLQHHKLRLHKQKMQRHCTQTLLQTFQSFHHLSNIVSDILNPLKQIDLRTAQLSKITHLAFNTSQFYTSTLFPRKQFQSLLILDNLEYDMEYEVLDEKDKQFVRDVIIKVCGRKNPNHSRYRTVSQFLKDQNAAVNQPKNQRIQLMSKTKRKKVYSKQYDSEEKQEQQITQEQENEEQYDLQDQQNDHYEEEQWKLLSQQLRNRAVRKIFDTQDSSKIKQYRSTISRKNLTNTLLLEIIFNLKLNEDLSQPTPQIEYELYKICKRLFKLTTETSSQEQTQKNTQGELQNHTSNKAEISETQKIPLLEDLIIEYDFIDQFVNRKKIIIV